MYKFTYRIFYCFSLLPWFVIYRISDFFYVLVYYIIGYRKKVVMENLKTAFPHKTEAERARIAKDFYHQFIDTFLETLKLLSISREELNKRFSCNYDMINDLYESGINIQLHGGHFFNWETFNLAYCINVKYPFMGVYNPLTNKIFDQLMYDMRARFGSILISSATFNRQFIKLSKGRYVLTLGCDQNSSNLSNAYWLPFFGKMAPFVTGPERMSVAKNAAILFVNTFRVKRGYYQSEIILYTLDPASLPKGEITIAFRNYLEDQIMTRPSNYLWTHRRWKHKFDPEKYKDMVLEEGNLH